MFDLGKIKIKRGEIPYGIILGYNIPLSSAHWFSPVAKTKITSEKPNVNLATFNISLYLRFMAFKNESQ